MRSLLQHTSTVLVTTFVFSCAGAPVTGDLQSPPLSSAPAAAGLLTAGMERAQLGETTILLRRTTNPIVRIGLFFEHGSADWSPETGGSALQLAFAALADGGPASMERDAFLASLEAMGSSLGGSAGYDVTELWCESVLPYWEPTWELFAATLRDPALRDDEVERARERLVTAHRSRFDDPDGAVVETARAAAFDSHPYAASPDGTEAGLTGTTAGQARAALAELLAQQGRLTVVVVGGVEMDQIVPRVEALLPPTEGASLPPQTPALAFAASRVAYLARPELPTNYLLGYFAAPAPGSAEHAALELGLAILDHRLFEEVRTRRNLTYAVAAGLGSRRANTGYLYVTAADPNATLQAMYETIEAMETTPVSAQELADQLEQYLTADYMALESNAAQASMLATWEILAGDASAADEHVAALRAVTPADVLEAIGGYVRNVQWAAVGDPAEVDEALFTSR